MHELNEKATNYTKTRKLACIFYHSILRNLMREGTSEYKRAIKVKCVVTANLQ